MIVNAIENAQSTDSTVLAEYISNIKDADGLTGKLTMDPKIHNPLNKPAVIETVKNGQFTFYKAFALQ